MTIPERIKLPKLDNDDVDKVCLDSYGIVYHHLEPSEVWICSVKPNTFSSVVEY